MAEYQLSRVRSSAIVRSNSVASRPTILLTRTYSVPDLTSYTGTTSHYRSPQWPSYYTSSSRYWPYRYYRDYSIADQYLQSRYSYFSPLYYRSMFPRRYSFSDHLANPYLWNDNSYWTRYKSYLYDYANPYSRYNYPYYNSYYSPYTYYKYSY